MSHPRINIVGAGLAGLSCAYYLEQAGFQPLIYERDGRIGGRIQTDLFQGFLLDRGFQVVLNNYPEFKTLFSPSSLRLKSIPSGARIYWNKEWFLLDNPLKHLSLSQLKNAPFIQQGDWWALAKGAWRAFQSPPNESTETFLRECGLSDAFIHAFWRPFFGGVFLELPLQTQAKTFIQLAKYFATGLACLPEQGMQAIPADLARRLKRTKIFTAQTVQAINHRSLILTSGEEALTDATVIATSGLQASHLIKDVSAPRYETVTCLYFTVRTNVYPFSPYLHLNGSGEGPINNVLFNHLIQPSYAPVGHGLVSVSVVDPEWQSHAQLTQQVTHQLCEWFELSEKEWRHLKTYRILQALPEQTRSPLFAHQYLWNADQQLYVCGETVEEPSINGALYSGRQVAQKIAAHFRNE